MGYNKWQRKMTAMVYSKRQLNKMAVNTYRNYSEVRDILNFDKGISKSVQNRGRYFMTKKW